MAGEEVPVPLLPMTVQGVALIDGAPAPTGTVVAAYLNEDAGRRVSRKYFLRRFLLSLFLEKPKMKENPLPLRLMGRIPVRVLTGNPESRS